VKVYEAVLDVLAEAGVEHSAGMVGSTTAPYVSTLAERGNPRYIAVRHEQVASAIIDAVGRLSRRPGCVLVHGAAGTLAASLGIAAAARDGTPMLVLSSTQERVAMERGYWQTLDVLRPLSGFVKYQMRVEHPDRAAEAVRRALLETVSGRPGVAQVDLPIDVSTTEVERTDAPLDRIEAPRFRPQSDAAAIAAARGVVANADRVVILVGGGAAYSDANAALVGLAERLHAPVVNTPTSRGIIAEDHPLCLGPSGIIGYEPAGDAIAEAEVVVAVGSRLSDLQLVRGRLLRAGVRIVHVDIDATVLGREFAADVEVMADARSFASALNNALDHEPVPISVARREWVTSLGARAAAWRQAWLDGGSDNGRVQPQEIVADLSAQLPLDAVLTHGAGDHAFYGFMVPVRPPGAHLMSTTLGAMGCGLGYAIGARLVRPEQPVVACLGDGEFMFQIGDLETITRERLPIVVVVFNNFRLGSQRKRLEGYGPVMGVDHTNPDFAELAELFGCSGYRVDAPGQFAEVLKDALTSGRPTVIDVLVDPDARPPRIAMSREAR